MEIRRTDNRKIQIREKEGMHLHRKEKKIRKNVGEGKSVLDISKVHSEEMRLKVKSSGKKFTRKESVRNRADIKERAEKPAFIIGKNKKKWLKREAMITAGDRRADRKEEESNTKQLEGKKEFLESGLVIYEGVHATNTGIETVAEKASRLKIHIKKSTIKRADTNSSRKRNGAAVKSNNSKSKKGGTVSRHKWTLKEKFLKLSVASAASRLFQRKQQEKQKVEVEQILLKAFKTKFIFAALSFMWGVVQAAVPVLLIITLLYHSPFALFMPKLQEGDSIQQVLTGYYQEFTVDLNNMKQESGLSITYANGNGVSNFRDVLMVYMVKYYTGVNEVGTIVNDKTKQDLKTVFDEMNYYKSETTTRKIKAGESLGSVVTSGYCNCTLCCGQWSGGPTASGAMPTPNHTIAVDAHNPFVPMGTKVLFNGNIYTVEDTGNFDRYGVQFDVYCSDHNTAQNWGHQIFECYLAEGDKNEVEVTSTSVNVYHLTYEDYIATGKLTKEQEELLRFMMTKEVWINFSDGTTGSMVALEAMTKVGCEYDQDRRYEEGVYDCSSLVQRLYRDIAGIELPPTAQTQGEYCYVNGMTVTEDMLMPGDLIFYSYEQNGDFMNISHVAIYVGDGMMVHAANSQRGVVYDPLIKSNVGLYGRPY